MENLKSDVIMKPISEVTNEDCMDMMKRYSNKFFDLTIPREEMIQPFGCVL